MWPIALRKQKRSKGSVKASKYTSYAINYNECLRAAKIYFAVQLKWPVSMAPDTSRRYWHLCTKYLWTNDTLSVAASLVAWLRTCQLAIGGELSKREGVLFHWWSFSSKRNDRLQLFYTDTRHLTSPSMLIWTSKSHNFVGYLFETVLHQVFFSFWGGAFGSERVHFHVQGVLAHPQNPNSPPLQLAGRHVR